MLTKYQWTKCSRAGRFVQNQVVSPWIAQRFCVSHYYQNLLNAIILVIMTKLVANPCDARDSLKKDNSAIIYWIVTFFEYDVCFKIT